MSNVFIIADLHLGHEKVAIARGFTCAENHDITLETRWNSVVGKRDSVFVLGDVAFGQQHLQRLSRFKGTKKLILGNHDKYPIHAYLPYFSQVFGCVRYKDCILSHIPVHESQFERYKYNIHGHLHNKIVTKSKLQYVESNILGASSDGIGWERKNIPDKRYICVSAEQTNLTPVLFSSLIGE